MPVHFHKKAYTFSLFLRKMNVSSLLGRMCRCRMCTLSCLVLKEGGLYVFLYVTFYVFWSDSTHNTHEKASYVCDFASVLKNSTKSSAWSDQDQTLPRNCNEHFYISDAPATLRSNKVNVWKLVWWSGKVRSKDPVKSGNATIISV